MIFNDDIKVISGCKQQPKKTQKSEQKLKSLITIFSIKKYLPYLLFGYFVHFFDSGGHCFCYHENSEWLLRPTLDWLFHPRRPRSCICYLKHWHWLQAEIPFTKAVKFPQPHEAQQFCKTIMAENSDDIPLFPRYQPETERRLVTRKGVTCVTGKRMRK